MGPGGASEPHRSEEFQSKPVGPIGVGEVEEFTAFGGAGVVDDDIDLTVGFDREIGQVGRRLRFAQVGGKRGCTAARAFDFAHGLLQ